MRPIFPLSKAKKGHFAKIWSYIIFDSVPWYGCYDGCMEKLTIGKLAEKSGVGVETVRFYQRKELLREPASSGSVRTYKLEDIDRIIFIKKAQELGFSLAEVK